MDTSFQRNRDSQEWYTPKWVIDKLGHFDLDPCSPITPPYQIADNVYNIETNGLIHEWKGRVFLNPPYKHPTVDKFVQKMISHNNGIALLFDRCEQEMWQKHIFPTASGLLFIRGRLKFLNKEGKIVGNAGCGSILISWGDDNAAFLKHCGIDGFFVDLRCGKWHTKPSPVDKPLLFKNEEGDIGCSYIDDDSTIFSSDMAIDGTTVKEWSEIPKD